MFGLIKNPPCLAKQTINLLKNSEGGKGKAQGSTLESRFPKDLGTDGV